MDSNDLLAKLLANENLTVVRGTVHTASFDIANRILVLPQWKDIPAETEEMLILHEVGHALYTDTSYGDFLKEAPASFRSYLNVVEDARIERKMKVRYPGSKRSFLNGYKYLLEKDFFEISGKNINTFNLIDRINLFYKIGITAGVKFSKKEWTFINSIDSAKTLEDVNEVALAIWRYAKEAEQQESQLIPMDALDDFAPVEESEEYDDYDDQLEGGNFQYENLDDSEEESEENSAAQPKEVSGGAGSGETDESDIESKTQKALHTNVENSADTSTFFQYYEPVFYEDEIEDRIVGYKTVLKEMEEVLRSREEAYGGIENSRYPLYSCALKTANQFKQDNIGIVNNMVKEFEMRKSASAWKRAKISKTGMLDPKKLFGYKIKDELFKQLTIVKDGKKHGMLFLLDWSGSMDVYMSDTIKQLINLIMFARKIQIPYRVFAFTSAYRSKEYRDMTMSFSPEEQEKVLNKQGLGSSAYMHMLELYNEKMSENETTKMTSMLMSEPWARGKQFSLGGTPLNEALISCINDVIPQFLRSTSAEKLIFVTLTDGEGVPLRVSETRLSKWVYTDTGTKRMSAFYRDPITGKQYKIDEDASSQTRALMNIIADRYGSHNIGFNLVYNNYRTVASVCNMGSLETGAWHIQSLLRSNKYAVLDFVGYNKYYLIDVKSLKVQNDINLDSISPESSAAAAAKTLGKALSKNKASRIVLNNFAIAVA